MLETREISSFKMVHKMSHRVPISQLHALELEQRTFPALTFWMFSCNYLKNVLVKLFFFYCIKGDSGLIQLPHHVDLESSGTFAFNHRAK